jgi:LysM repeat protein
MGNVSVVMKQGRVHTRKVARELLGGWKIHWMWINGAEGHHAAGRAVDLMTLTANQRQLRNGVGNEIAAHVRKHHRRLGVEYVIWRQRIWNATRASDGSRVGWSAWRVMEDRGNPTANHLDHVHISFLDHPSAYRPLGKPSRRPRDGEVRYTVRRGDILIAIARRFGTTVTAIARRNGIVDRDRIVTGRILVIPATSRQARPATYTVRRGDTLAAIARRFRTTVTAIAKRNGITDPDRIRTGQVLAIPGGPATRRR